MGRFWTRRPKAPPGGPAAANFRPELLAPRPAPLRDDQRSTRTWWKDRAKFDLNRPLPPGAVPEKHLKYIDPGLFYVWNRVVQRWEVWCHRPVLKGWKGTGMAYSTTEPYYVMRVCVHPRTRDRWGQIKQVCPAKPMRYKNAVICPPSCPGVYYIPDTRLLGVLAQASYMTNNMSPEATIEQIEKQEALDAAYLEAAYTTAARDVWGEIYDHAGEIKRVSVAG